MGDLGGSTLRTDQRVEYLDNRLGRPAGWHLGVELRRFLSLMAKFRRRMFSRSRAGAPVSNWLHDTSWVVPCWETQGQ